jgi:hypothetical protein
MKAYWGWMYSSTHSLTSAIDGGERSASHPSHFTPREGAPVNLWIGSWVGLTASLDAVEKRKFPAPVGTGTPELPARSSALYH